MGGVAGEGRHPGGETQIGWCQAPASAPASAADWSWRWTTKKMPASIVMASPPTIATIAIAATTIA
jgi:hypothetical protein